MLITVLFPVEINMKNFNLSTPYTDIQLKSNSFNLKLKQKDL
jgi:hypothetical protein